eukprot:TRINITY_DN71591_c0_g1_i1.p1 TRINITY_DN71591_c0_g1~~TRINITY_DN71591_c0_g1_i1.p1  ORF type:complete len:366 (+),score=54.59 TRINITY_DN71591_c0_g1_i1:64-1098(+)
MAERRESGNDINADPWILAFVADVEAGHAGRTMALVEAIRDGKPTSDASVRLGVDALKRDLDSERSAAARNRLLRRWLTTRKLDVISNWPSIGFPPSPHLVGEALAEEACVRSLPRPRTLTTPSDVGTNSRHGDHVRTGGSQSHSQGTGCAGLSRFVGQGARSNDACNSTGIVVFDFDQTLTTKHVSVFEDMDRIVDRGFGGTERLAMLGNMLTEITTRGIAITVVTRNSRHVVRKVLNHVGLLRFVTDDFIFGFEDYEDEVPKSHVVRSRIVAALGSEDDVLFVDDDPSNITDMRAHCPGAQVLLAPRTGLGQDECHEIIAWADRFAGAGIAAVHKSSSVHRC